MKEIMIKIVASQKSNDGIDDTMEIITEAKLYEKNSNYYLIYDETEISGMPGCRTRLKIGDKVIQMKRLGNPEEGNNEIRFEKGTRFEGYYRTPFGSIEMEVLTNQLKNTFFVKEDGEINIDYSISLKGLMEGQNTIKITKV